MRPVKAIPAAGRLGKWIDHAGIVFALGIIAAMLILIQEVVLRYVFNSPTQWAHETTIFLCALAFIYGGLYCVARDSHIRVVLIYDALNARWRRVADVVISLFCMISSGFFAWAAWDMVKKGVFRPDGGVHLETSGSAWDPAYPGYLKLFLFLVLILMTLQFLILAYHYAIGHTARVEDAS